MKRFFVAISFVALAAGQTAPVVPAPAAPATPTYKTLKYPPLPQVKIPEPAEFTLSNGMRVLLLEDHELPLVRGVAMIHMPCSLSTDAATTVHSPSSIQQPPSAAQ